MFIILLFEKVFFSAHCVSSVTYRESRLIVGCYCVYMTQLVGHFYNSHSEPQGQKLPVAPKSKDLREDSGVL